MQKSQEPVHPLRHAGGGKDKSTQPRGEEGAEQDGICSSDEHHHQGSRPNQGGGAEIDLGNDKRNQQRRRRQRNDEAKNQVAGAVLKTNEPPRQKEYCGGLGNFRRLKCDRASPDPATRPVNTHSEMRHETKPQSSEGEKEPQPPGVIPEMVIDQCCSDQNREPDPEPESLAFDEKVNIAVGITRE